MKTSLNPITYPTSALIPAMLLALGPFAIAQTVDTSTGEVGNSSTSPSNVPLENPTPTRLAALIAGVQADSKVRGEISFSIAGDGLNVSGRIDGLVPNMRYLLAVATPANGKEEPAPDAVEKAPSDAGTPAAGPPKAGAPEAGSLESGEPDGTSRPGAAGAGTQASGVSRNRASSGGTAAEMSKTTGALGTLTADVKGGTNINLTARNMDLTDGPTGLQQRMVTLTWIPDAGSEQQRVMVAEGVIGIPAKAGEGN